MRALPEMIPALIATIGLSAIADAQDLRWSSFGAAHAELYGVAVSPTGDLDQDSIPDVIVGAPGADGVAVDAGRAEVLSGLGGAPILQLSGAAADDGFGAAVGDAGDVDQDGTSDVSIGAPQDGAGAGYVRIVSGQSGTTLVLAAGAAAGDRFGAAVAAAGDLDLDGVPDTVIGAPGAAGVPGYAQVRSGATGVVLVTFTGAAAGDAFGRSVAGLGDLDLDGFPEVAVGAPGATFSAASPGYARVFNGIDGSVRFTVTGAANGDHFGVAVGGGGDVNGDGAPDLVVGADQVTNLCNPPGYAQVRSGSDGSPIHQFTGDGTSDFFGRSVSIAGDVNGDGRDDVLVGAPETFLDCEFFQTGYARLFSGFTGGALYTFVGDTPGDDVNFSGGSFGVSARIVPDADGDGRADVVIGGSFEEGPGGLRTGRANRYDGNDLFLDAQPKAPFPNSTVSLTTAEGVVGNPTLMLLTELGGVPASILAGGIGSFAPDQRRVVTAPVPAGFPGLVARFRAYALDAQGQIIDTAVETIVLN